MFESIKNSNITWIILSLCTIASLVFGIYSWIKSQKRKQLTYATKSNYIIQNNVRKIEKLDLMFDGKKINNLTITTFVIWNSQNTEIRSEDIVSDYELSISGGDEAEILDARILYESEPANKFTIIDSTSQGVRFSFEYVDKKEGFVVQLIHTGKPKDLTVTVKIKGGDPLREYVNITYKKKPRLKYVLGWIGTVLSEICFLAIIISTIISLDNNSNTSRIVDSESPLFLKIVLITFLAVGFIGVGFSSVYEIRKTIKSSVPNCFREYI